MGNGEGPKRSPRNPKHRSPKQPEKEAMFSPGFRSVAAMAGWDEETILIASLVVEDTPDRELKHQKRSRFPSKTPPLTKSRSKKKAQRSRPVSIPVPLFNLEEEEEKKEESEKKKVEVKVDENEGKKTEDELCCSSSGFPCMDRLREELSCAVCLEICFEPSTTSCGHSFCKKCLRSAADKCGKKCPKCRQLISNGRSCTVNTVLWNTIQLLFPEEVEARKAAGAQNGRESERRSPGKVGPMSSSVRDRNEWIFARVLGRGGDADSRRPSRVSSSRRRGGPGPVPGQDEDAAMALRLQREEFMEAFRGSSSETEEGGRRNSVSLARANLRAMASRATSIRASRGRPI